MSAVPGIHVPEKERPKETFHATYTSGSHGIGDVERRGLGADINLRLRQQRNEHLRFTIIRGFQPARDRIGQHGDNRTSASTSGAKSVASTRSSSGASANPTLTSSTATNVYVTDPNGGGGSGTSGAGTAATLPSTSTMNTNYSGSYTVRNTPEVIAPT